MINSNIPKAPKEEMQKLVERLSPLQCDCEGSHTDACIAFGKVHYYIRTLEAEHKAMKEALEKISAHEISWGKDMKSEPSMASIDAKKALSSLTL